MERATDRQQPDAPPTREDIDRLRPREDGKVYCCSTLGWVTPDVAFDHRWDTSRTPDEYLSERAHAWDGVEPGR